MISSKDPLDPQDNVCPTFVLHADVIPSVLRIYYTGLNGSSSGPLVGCHVFVSR
jgi:hypothetical protein